MTALGSFALDAALAVALYGIIAAAAALRRDDPALGEVARRALLGWSAAVVLAAAALLYALVTRDFSLRFVAETTSRDLSLGYTVTAFWGGHAGSLLLWTLVLSLYAVAAASSLRRLPAAPAVYLTLLAVAAFFTATLLAGSPFEPLPLPPPDGRGLNPLLHNPWMAFHPPALYLGFVGTTVPFALTVAALVGRDPSGAARRAARSWMRVSWLLLTTGLLFGAKWSYVVLGWGGYWAWDPVENAALMPWLTGAAYLHAAQVAERTGRLRDWSAALVLASFELSILGTFLTRSGVLSSVHAFADSGIGAYLLAFLAASSVLSIILLRRGRGVLGEPRSAAVEAVPGREAALLASTVLLAVAAAAVLVGTLYPIVVEAATGVRINVGPPYFHQVLVPLAVLLLPLMAVGPLLPWGALDLRRTRGLLAAPAALGVLAALGAAAAGLRRPGVLLVGSLAVFAAAATVVEMGRPWVGRRWGYPGAAGAPQPARVRPRFGGTVAHLGLLVMLAGITASSAFTTQTEVALRPGEQARLERYVVRYDAVRAMQRGDRTVTEAALTASDGRREIPLAPRHLYHRRRDTTTAEVAIRSSWRDDLYVVLVGLAADGRATLRIVVSPLVAWLWAGAAMLIAGAAWAALPAAPRRRASAGARDEAISAVQPEAVP